MSVCVCVCMVSVCMVSVCMVSACVRACVRACVLNDFNMDLKASTHPASPMRLGRLCYVTVWHHFGISFNSKKPLTSGRTPGLDGPAAGGPELWFVLRVPAVTQPVGKEKSGTNRWADLGVLIGSPGAAVGHATQLR